MEEWRESLRTSLHHLCRDVRRTPERTWQRVWGFFSKAAIFEDKKKKAFVLKTTQSWAYLLLQAEVKRIWHHLLADDTQTDKLSINGRGGE